MLNLINLNPLANPILFQNLDSIETEPFEKKDDFRKLVEDRLLIEADKLTKGGTSRQSRIAHAAVAETLERNKTRIRLKNQLLQRTAMEIRTALKELGDAIIGFSDHPKIKESTASSSRLHDAEIAERYMKELLDEEEQKATRKSKRRLSKTYRKENHRLVKKNNAAISGNQNVKRTEKKIKRRSLSHRNVSVKQDQSGQKLMHFALKIMSDSFNMPQHPRIHRWKTEDVSTIRNFVDRDDRGGQISRYNHLSEKDIRIQRARHYLPGTERLLKDPSYRSIYAFETNRGYGMACRLSYNNIKQEGILYFGVGDDKTIFHKYFEDQDFDTLNEDIFEDQEVRDSDLTENFEDWEVKGDFSLDVSPNGILTFGYSDHMLEVLPLKKALFDRMIKA